MIKLVTLGLVSCVLIACDLDQQVTAEPKKEPEGSQEARTLRRTKFKLVSEEPTLARGSKTNDERRIDMDRLVLRIRSGEETTGSGNLSINYSEKRTVDVVSPNIWRITPVQHTVAVNLAINGQEPAVVNTDSPLQGEALTLDRDQLSMSGVPNDAQKKALEEYQGQWFGGDALFPNHEVKRSDAWQIKPEVMLEAIFGSKFTETTGTVQMHVNQVMNFDGHECVEISTALDRCKGTMIDADGKKTLIELHCYGSLYRALDVFQVVKVELKGDVRVTMEGPEGLEMKGSGGVLISATSTVEVAD